MMVHVHNGSRRGVACLLNSAAMFLVPERLPDSGINSRSPQRSKAPLSERLSVGLLNAMLKTKETWRMT